MNAFSEPSGFFEARRTYASMASNPLLPLSSPPPPLPFISASVICVLRPSAIASITRSTAAAAGPSDPLHASHELLLAPIISYKQWLLRADGCVADTRNVCHFSRNTAARTQTVLWPLWQEAMVCSSNFLVVQETLVAFYCHTVCVCLGHRLYQCPERKTARICPYYFLRSLALQ